MSGGTGCKCRPEAEVGARLVKPTMHERRMRTWVVVTRHGNHSAFNGYRFTPSSYSAIRCTACGGVWRTANAYVERLPDAPHSARADHWPAPMGVRGVPLDRRQA